MITRIIVRGPIEHLERATRIAVRELPTMGRTCAFTTEDYAVSFYLERTKTGVTVFVTEKTNVL